MLGAMPTDHEPSAPAMPASLGFRLLAMLYDSLPVLALWLLTGAVTLALHGGRPIAPWTALFWLQVVLLWAVCGAYCVLSWRRGGQTLGMRPWRLRVVDADGRPVANARLWQRYALATLSLAAAGIGFLWSLLDRNRRCWHDIGSGTWLVRLPRTSA